MTDALQNSIAIDLLHYVKADGVEKWQARFQKNLDRAIWDVWTEVYMDRTMTDDRRYSSAPRRLAYVGAGYRLYPAGDERKTRSMLKRAYRSIEGELK